MEDRRKPTPGRTALAALGGAVLMLGAAFAAVPAYEAFCRVTGYGGTPGRADAGLDEAPKTSRTFTVRFDANVDPDLPWEFRPTQKTVRIKPGVTGKTAYVSRNAEDRPVAGRATFTVLPEEAAPYFKKIACFCFDRQELAAGQKREMPVTFFVDPAILEENDLKQVSDITLSYTFHPEEGKSGAEGT